MHFNRVDVWLFRVMRFVVFEVSANASFFCAVISFFQCRCGRKCNDRLRFVCVLASASACSETKQALPCQIDFSVDASASASILRAKFNVSLSAIFDWELAMQFSDDKDFANPAVAKLEPIGCHRRSSAHAKGPKPMILQCVIFENEVEVCGLSG